ncbi:MAG TPA: hypothetical protein VMX16_11555 [Terriglobia bacterium]|nr:hypothetical protein [Terriglobia bacterium]
MRKTVFCLLPLALASILVNAAAAPQQTVRMNVTSTQGMSPGYKVTPGIGLLLNLSAGTSFCGGAIQNYQGGSLTMAASATNYVYLDPSSNCAPAVNTSGFMPDVIPIATVVTGTSVINTVSDARTVFMALAPSGAGVGSCGSNQFVTGVNNGTGPSCAQPAFSNLSGTAAIAQLPVSTTTSLGLLQLSGDLAGKAATPSVVGLQGKPISATTPVTNQVLEWNGSQWAPSSLPPGAGTGTCGSNQFVNSVNTGIPTCAQPTFSNLSGTAAPSQLPAATSSTPGIIQLAGDLGGTGSIPKVVALQGVPVSAATPSNGQVPQFNSSTGQWTPATLPPGGTVSSVGLSVPPEFTVSGSPVTTSGTLTITKASQTANLIYAGPASGSAAVPSFRSLAAADLPAASTTAQGAVQLSGDFAGTGSSPQVVSTHLVSPLPTAQGGSGSGTLVAHGVLLGEGAGAFGVAGPGSTGQCLLSNGAATDPSFSTCPGGAGTPGGSNTQLQFDNNGAFGGASNLSYTSGTGVVTLGQFANGNETLYGTRTTDTSPTGNLIHFQNAAMNLDLFKVDTSGNVTATSFTSTASGPFIFSGSEGTCMGATTGKDLLCLGDSKTHSALLSLNGGTFVPVPQLTGDLGGTAAAPQVVSTHLTSPLTVAQGGTGQATASAAFNSLAPATATGGLIVANGTNSYGNLALGTSGQCLTSNGQSAAWGACASGGGIPGGSNTQLQFDNNGAFGGASNLSYTSGTGVVTLGQLANGNETLYGTRTTDTSPTGNLIHFQNAAMNVDLFKVDASGNVTATSFTSTASGPFIFSGSEGTCTGATTGKDLLCLGDSNTHSALLSLNGGAFVPVPQLTGDLGGTAAAPQVVSIHLTHLTQNAANGDIAGTIALTSATSASHPFSKAFNSVPICVLTPTSKPGTGQLWWVTATTTSVTANVGTAATISFNYHCVGNPT